MKPPGVSRREFLRVAGYGCVLAAGSGCSLAPLTALMADPPRPYPPRARAGGRIGLCAMCPGGCGIRARLVEGRIIGIAGNPLHPISRGALCPRGAAGIEALYHPDRPRGALRRRAGVETAVGRDAAIAEAAGGIREALAGGAPIAVVGASPSALDAAFLHRFAAALGAIETDLRTLRTPRALAPFAATQGIDRSVHFDLARADTVLSFDPTLLEAPWSAVQIQRAFAEFRRGRPERRGRFIVVSPRRTTTAIKADEWVPTRPGTEGVLALGVAHVLAKENLVDWEARAGAVSGADDFRREVLAGYGMEYVSRATGVPEAAIVRIARDLSSAEAPLVVSPVESDVLPPHAVAAIHSLNALLDRIDRPGGVLVGRFDETIDLSPTFAAPPRADDDEPLCERILAGFPVGVLLIHDANPVADLPDGARWADAIRRVPLVVSFSSRRDETSALAHVQIPDATYLEKWGVHAGATTDGHPVWSVGEPVVETPVHEDARPVGETLIALARAIGGRPAEAFPWTDTAEVVRRYAEGLHDHLRQGLFFGPDVEEMWSSLLERSGWRSSTVGSQARFHARWTEAGGWWDPHYPFGETRRVLGHADRRFHLVTDLPWPVPETPTGDLRDFPLLAVAHRPAALAGGGPAGLPSLRGLIAPRGWPVGETFVEVHPDDAAEAGLRDGAAVRVVSPHGTVPAVVKATEGVAHGVVAVLVGLGRTAGGRWEVGWGSSAAGLFDALHHRQGKGLVARVRLEPA